MTERSKKGFALITGASYGIGYELAKIFAQNGYSLVLVARSREKLETLKLELETKYSVRVEIIPKDLSRYLSSEEIYREVMQRGIQIDILVNNAGFGTYGYFSEIDLDTELQMMQLNMITLTHMTKLFLKGMVERKSGKIMNVASTAAFQPGPIMAVYYATKAYVLSFSNAIREELRKKNIQVSTLCPGPTTSDFQARAGIGKIPLFKLSMMDAQTVAKKGYEGLMKNKAEVIPGLLNKLLVWGNRLSPTCLTVKIVRFLQRKKIPLER